MDVRYINPFITSMMNVLTTMCQLTPTVGKPGIKEGNKTSGSVTGIIGMAGHEVSGNLIISFDEASILEIVSKLLMEEFKEINKDVTDAVGEITNMVSGGSKKLLAEEGFSFDMATPIVVVGQNLEVNQLSKGPIISIPFSTSKGKFVLEASLEKLKRKP